MIVLFYLKLISEAKITFYITQKLSNNTRCSNKLLYIIQSKMN